MKTIAQQISAILFMLFMLTACNLGSNAANEEIIEDDTASLTIVEITPETEVTEASITVAANTSDDDSSTEDTTPIPTTVATTTSNNQQTTSTCTPRTDWQTYRIVSGDTLFVIAGRVGSTVSALTTANCLTNANAITVGQQLYVPRLPQTTTNNTSNTPCTITATQRTPIVDSPQGTGRTTIGYLENGETATPVLHFDGLPYWGILVSGGMGWVNIQPTGDCSSVARSADDLDIPMGDGDGTGSTTDATCRVESSAAITVYSEPTTATVARTVDAGTYEIYQRSPGGWVNISPSNQMARWTQLPPLGSCQLVEIYLFDCQFIAESAAPVYREPNFNADVVHTTSVGTEYRYVGFGGIWQSDTGEGGWYRILFEYSPPSAGYVNDDTGRLNGLCYIE